MADLNLDGLPVLTTLTTEAGIECNVPIEIRLQVIVELRQLVERERVRAVAEAEDRELSAAEQLKEFEPEVTEVLQAAFGLMETIDDPDQRLSLAFRALKHHQRKAAGLP